MNMAGGGVDIGAINAAERTLPRAWYGLAALTIAVLFGVIDRQIFVLVTEPMKTDLAINDVQIGVMLSLGPALLAAVASVPLGWLADRVERRTVLVACVLLWSLATGACGLAKTYPQLLMASIAIGVGEGALGPVVYSLIPDLFAGEQRLRANLIFFAAAMVGAGLGLSLGGWVLQSIAQLHFLIPAAWRTLANWRQAFLIVALPGPLIGLAIVLIGPIPRRGMTEAAARASSSISGYFRQHGWTVSGIYMAGGLYSLAVGAVFAWGAVIAIRVLNASAGRVGVALGLAIAIGSLIGTGLASGSLGFWVRRAGVGAPLRAARIAMFLAVIPVVALLTVQRPWQVYLAIGGILAAGTMGIAFAPTMLQDIAPAGLRGRVIAISSLVSVVVGASSPIMVGALSNAFAAEPRGLIWAVVLVAAPAFLLSGALFGAIEPRFRRSMAALGDRASDPGPSTDAD